MCFKTNKKYILREATLNRLIKRMEEDVFSIFTDLKEVAKEIDQNLDGRMN